MISLSQTNTYHRRSGRHHHREPQLLGDKASKKNGLPRQYHNIKLSSVLDGLPTSITLGEIISGQTKPKNRDLLRTCCKGSKIKLLCTVRAIPAHGLAEKTFHEQCLPQPGLYPKIISAKSGHYRLYGWQNASLLLRTQISRMPLHPPTFLCLSWGLLVLHTARVAKPACGGRVSYGVSCIHLYLVDTAEYWAILSIFKV